MGKYRVAGAVLAVMVLAACGGQSDGELTPVASQQSDEQPSPSDEEVETTSELPSPTAAQESEPADISPEAAVERLEALSQVEEITTITEDNDPNDLIGRPNGYVAAFVIDDEGLECPELGVSCGATLEVWPDESGAQDRSEYIQAILKETPAFGTEYHYIKGAMLLRVVGEVKPSSAEQYEVAFTG